MRLKGYIYPLMRTLTALIPFFNEERTIVELVRQLNALPQGILSDLSLLMMEARISPP